MLKIRAIILFTLLFITISCKDKLSNSENFIQNLSNETDFELPMANESLLIFVLKDDIVYMTRLRQLYLLKEKDSKGSKDFDRFLVDVINKNLLSKEELKSSSIDTFKLNREILSQFEKKGIDYLKKKYCDTTSVKGKLYLKQNLDFNLQQNLMYIFFKNNYYIMQNDYTGKNVLIDKNNK